MINKDYILRLAEEIGRELSIVLGLRKRDKNEDALIYIDNLLLKIVGLTSRFINSLSEEILVQTLSPINTLNVEATLWIASLLKEESDIYTRKGDTHEGYYRAVKSLYLYLTVLEREPVEDDAFIYTDIEALLKQLEEYELSSEVRRKLFSYYERIGQYANAEDILFELLAKDQQTALLEQGYMFYQRLTTKSDADLETGNLNRDEVQEGMAQMAKKLGHELVE